MDPVKDTAEDYPQKYPLAFVDSEEKKEKSLSQRYARAWQIAREASLILKKTFGATKVIVFGSLADHFWFSRWSDVDLAVWGIPDDRFYAAVAAVTAISKEFDIDLVDGEKCRPSLQKAIEKGGIEL